MSLDDAKVVLDKVKGDIEKINDRKWASVAEIIFNLQRGAEKTFKGLLKELEVPYKRGHGGQRDRIIDEEGLRQACSELKERVPNSQFDVAKRHLIRAWTDSTLIAAAREAADYGVPGVVSAVEAWNNALDVPVARALHQQFLGTYFNVQQVISWMKEYKSIH